MLVQIPHHVLPVTQANQFKPGLEYESSGICVGWIERLLALEDAVRKDEKLPHRGGKGEHFGLSGSDKAVIKGFDNVSVS